MAVLLCTSRAETFELNLCARAPTSVQDRLIAVRLSLGWIRVMLLAILIVTGYRNVLRALRWDPSRGGASLAFFITGLVYSPTEAGSSSLPNSKFVSRLARSKAEKCKFGFP